MPKSPTTDEQIAGMTFTVVQRNGRWCHLWSDGTLLPVVSGGSDAPPNDPPPGDPPPPADPLPPDVKFTPEQQAEVDKIVQGRVGEEKRKATTAATEQLAKDLGVPLDQAKTIIAEAKARADADKDEKTKREAAETERDAAKAAEKVVIRDAAIRIAVADADVDKAARGDVALLVSNELGADKLEPTDDEVTAALEAVKKRAPALFTAKKGTPGDPGNPPGGGGGGKTGMEAGRERAKAENDREAKQPAFLGGLQPLGGERVSA